MQLPGTRAAGSCTALQSLLLAYPANVLLLKQPSGLRTVQLPPDLSGLQALHIVAPEASCLADAPLPSTLRALSFAGCAALTQLTSLPDGLTSLNIAGCCALESLPGTLPQDFHTLTLGGCTKLAHLSVLPALQRCQSLHVLDSRLTAEACVYWPDACSQVRWLLQPCSVCVVQRFQHQDDEPRSNHTEGVLTC